jgi:hypothetical protein
MRHGPCLTHEQSLALLEMIDRWSRRTGTRYNKLVVMARVSPSTRFMVRCRGSSISHRVARRLIAVMRSHRAGISREEYKTIPKPWDFAVTESRLDNAARDYAQAMTLRVVRTTCTICGARSDFGCEHFERITEMRMS